MRDGTMEAALARLKATLDTNARSAEEIARYEAAVAQAHAAQRRQHRAAKAWRDRDRKYEHPYKD